MFVLKISGFGHTQGNSAMMACIVEMKVIPRLRSYSLHATHTYLKVLHVNGQVLRSFDLNITEYQTQDFGPDQNDYLVS